MMLTRKKNIKEVRGMDRKKDTKTARYKSAPADFTVGDNGTISGYFSTFHHDHGDSYGQVIKKGAFLGTIARRKLSGHPFPLCFNHNFDYVIGAVTDIGEDSYGAWYEAKFFPTEKAQEIRGFVKAGAVFQMSFAYDVLDQGLIKAEDGTTVDELRELELYEISLVVIPANSRAIITGVKGGDFSEDILSTEAKRLDLLRLINRMDAKSRGDDSKQLEAEVTAEETGITVPFVRDGTDEDGRNVWTAAEYKTEKDHTYLVRITGAESTEFTLRIVKKSILARERKAENTEGTAEAPEEKLKEETGEDPDEQPENPAGEEVPEEETEEPTEEVTPEEETPEEAEEIYKSLSLEFLGK